MTGRAAWSAIFVLFPLIALAFVSGCGYGESTGESGGPATVTGGGTVEVKLRSNRFNPAELTVDKGSLIRWINEDGYLHNVTSDNQKFDSGNFNKGQTFEFAFAESGTFKYSCTIHPSMRGTITVK